MDRYVDPNSGAAPQPGGYAGPGAAEKGFAIPVGVEVENELSPAEYVAPGVQDAAVEPEVVEEESGDSADDSVDEAYDPPVAKAPAKKAVPAKKASGNKS